MRLVFKWYTTWSANLQGAGVRGRGINSFKSFLQCVPWMPRIKCLLNHRYIHVYIAQTIITYWRECKLQYCPILYSTSVLRGGKNKWMCKLMTYPSRYACIWKVITDPTFETRLVHVDLTTANTSLSSYCTLHIQVLKLY